MPRFSAAALRNFVAIVGVLALAGYIVVYANRLVDAPIRSDAYSYYVYLPSWFLYGDASLDAVARDCCGGVFPEFTGIRRWPGTGRWVDPHPIGVAVQMAPFFGLAHALTRWSNLPPDGFSLYYQHAAGLAGLSAFLAGLFVLRRYLSRHFSAGVTLAALTTITFGTNLFHYGVNESTFSHAFSFFLVACLIDLTERWWDTPEWWTSLQLSAVSTLLILTRHTNAIFLLLVPLFGIESSADVGGRILTAWQRRRQVAAMVLILAAGVAPQAMIYEHATGHWIVNAYAQLGGFTFASPHLWGVLFGTQKGLFFWSPVLLFAVAGCAVPDTGVARIRLPAMIIFPVNVYLIASWFDWQFGGSFGHRAFTDGLALAAVFVAGFFDWVSHRRRLVPPVAAIATMLVLLSTAQMIQYWLRILPIADTTWEQYRAVFLTFR
jgi:hypothetical protein